MGLDRQGRGVGAEHLSPGGQLGLPRSVAALDGQTSHVVPGSLGRVAEGACPPTGLGPERHFRHILPVRAVTEEAWLSGGEREGTDPTS